MPSECHRMSPAQRFTVCRRHGRCQPPFHFGVNSAPRACAPAFRPRPAPSTCSRWPCPPFGHREQCCCEHRSQVPARVFASHPDKPAPCPQSARPQPRPPPPRRRPGLRERRPRDRARAALSFSRSAVSSGFSRVARRGSPPFGWPVIRRPSYVPRFVLPRPVDVLLASASWLCERCCCERGCSRLVRSRLPPRTEAQTRGRTASRGASGFASLSDRRAVFRRGCPVHARRGSERGPGVFGQAASSSPALGAAVRCRDGAILMDVRRCVLALISFL